MKFSGKIGFLEKEREVNPGVWRPEIVERSYVGEIIRPYRKYSQTDKQNTDLTLNNQISILSDLYARQNYQSIAYVEWNGVKWIVTGIEMTYPRLVLDLGGTYNGPKGVESITTT